MKCSPPRCLACFYSDKGPRILFLLDTCGIRTAREGASRSRRTEERTLMLLGVLMSTAQQMASLAASLASSSHTNHSEQPLLRCRDNCSSPPASLAPSINIRPSEATCVRVRGCNCALVTFCLFGVSWLFLRLSPIWGILILVLSLCSFLSSDGLSWPCFSEV